MDKNNFDAAAKGGRMHFAVILRRFIAVLALLAPASAISQTFSFDLFALEASGARLMSSASLPASADDTVVTRWPHDATVMDKELPLRNGFVVGLNDHTEPKITGLGFWLKRFPSPMEASRYPGFSWEWFDLASDGTFEKRKGSGRIRIRTQRVDGRDLITAVEFLDDVTFQMNAEPHGKPGVYTHEIHIKKGSRLAFKPVPGVS